jgi:hypothetical protein
MGIGVSMKIWICTFILIFSQQALCGGNIPLLFTPQRPQEAVLRWSVDGSLESFVQFDSGVSYSRTLVLTNYGVTTSTAITVSITGGNPVFTLINNGCNGTLLPADGRCTVDVNFGGGPDVPVHQLHGTAGITIIRDLPILTCSGC